MNRGERFCSERAGHTYAACATKSGGAQTILGETLGRPARGRVDRVRKQKRASEGRKKAENYEWKRGIPESHSTFGGKGENNSPFYLPPSLPPTKGNTST
jgi:hypothetical protein